MKERCVNFCDIYCALGEDKAVQIAREYGRVYVGSYFCFNALVSVPIKKYVHAFKGKRLTLVLPVCTETAVDGALSYLKRALDTGAVDEVVVNDFGFLIKAHELKGKYGFTLTAGRLISRSMRDARYASFVPVLGASGDFYSALFEEYGVDRLELDGVWPGKAPLFDAAKTGVHTPFVFQTTGGSCEFASVGKELSQKFRPVAGCGHKCSRFLLEYEREGTRYIKFGKTVFYGVNCFDVGEAREIFFPLEEVLK
jgi:hypothetical protein